MVQWLIILNPEFWILNTALAKRSFARASIDFHSRHPFLWLLVFFVALLLWLRLRRAVALCPDSARGRDLW